MKFTWQHIAVISAGVLIFVLLFFAEKTALKSEPEATETETENASETASESTPVPSTAAPAAMTLLGSLEPLPEIPEVDSLRNQLNETTDPEQRAGMLQRLVVILRDVNRLDAAALYAGALADEQPEMKNQLVAGALCRNAAQNQPAVSNPELSSSLFDLAFSYLESAKEKEAENEEVLIELGLAYVQSGRMERSMQGIQTLKSVLELNPNNQEALFNLGIFSIQSGQLDKAEERFEQVLALNPEDVVAKYYLANVSLDLGKTERGKALLQEVVTQAEDSRLSAEAKKILDSLK